MAFNNNSSIPAKGSTNRNVATASSMRPERLLDAAVASITITIRSRTAPEVVALVMAWAAAGDEVPAARAGNEMRTANIVSIVRASIGIFESHVLHRRPQLCRQCSLLLLRRANLRQMSWHRRIGTAVRQQLIIWGPAATMVLHVIVPS